MKEGANRPYRPTRASIPWLFAAGILIPYELVTVWMQKEGGPLSHVMWWVYGEPYTTRWWLVGGAMTGFIAWMGWHFLFRWPDLPAMLWLVGAGVAVGVIGIIVTR